MKSLHKRMATLALAFLIAVGTVNIGSVFAAEADQQTEQTAADPEAQAAEDAGTQAPEEAADGEDAIEKDEPAQIEDQTPAAGETETEGQTPAADEGKADQTEGQTPAAGETETEGQTPAAGEGKADQTEGETPETGKGEANQTESETPAAGEGKANQTEGETPAAGEGKADSAENQPNQTDAQTPEEKTKEETEKLQVFTAEGMERAGGHNHVIVGNPINYSALGLGTGFTNWFWLEDNQTYQKKVAYCLEADIDTPKDRWYQWETSPINNEAVRKALYYGFGGPGDISAKLLGTNDETTKYAYTHIAVSVAYAGRERGFYGCSDAGKQKVQAYINQLNALSVPSPDLNLSTITPTVTVVEVNGKDVQKTADIILQGDSQNSITLTVPDGVTAYNKTKTTQAEGGNTLTIYGGDTFYLTAELSRSGTYRSGELPGSVKTWSALVLDTGKNSAVAQGNQSQDIGTIETSDPDSVSFSVTWKPQARVQLTKTDATDSTKMVAGAVYGVYSDKGCTTKLAEMTTEADGTVTSDYFSLEGVTDGTVYVKELTAPEGYFCDKKVHEVTVAAGETPATLTVSDQPAEVYVKITKKDIDTGKTVLKAGASYQIYQITDTNKKGTLVTQKDAEGKEVDTFVTDKDGYVITPEKLSAGTYEIREVKAPEGYVRQGYGSLTGSEYTEEQKKQLQDPIQITIASDTEYKVDAQGNPYLEVEQYDREIKGKLILTKFGEKLTDGSGPRMRTESGEESSVTWSYQKSRVEGAKFELYAKEEILAPDGSGTVLYQKDALVDTLTTDKSGTAEKADLPLGSYYLKEVTAGTHYVRMTDPIDVTLKAEDDMAAVVYADKEVTNDRQKLSISLVKQDAVSKKPLEGVEFGLYAKEDIYPELFGGEKKALIQKDALIETGRTDKDGKLTFQSDLPHGKYYVKEVKSIPGYVANAEMWDIDATYDPANQDASVLSYTHTFENQPTETRITKRDAATGKELEGAKLQVLDAKGTLMEEWISTKEEHVIYGLPAGTYTLHEEYAPYGEGYVSAQDATFEVREDGSVTKAELRDSYSRIQFSKKDQANGKELAGAKLQILDKNGKVLDEWVSDGKVHSLEKLPVKEELTLHEVQAPAGYELAEDVKFTLKDTEEIQKVEMEDARIETSSSHTSQKEGPKTGDSANLWLPIALGVTALIVLAGVVIGYKKRRH